ncbi:phosphatase PAP2 family protein [Bdellovibrio sp. HCB274]|uniref:phosphatase PAP2 family protein n=1 Tax=Bdellovibrio sp. HCB274 TaxID=3394361 RepID=UPI0039B6347B
MLDFILNLDKRLFTLINSEWTAPWADAFFPFITDLHKKDPVKIVCIPLIIALFIWRRGWKKGCTIFVMAVLSVSLSDGIGNWGFKKTVQRPRPANTENLTVTVRAPFGGYSFVSNHATNIFNFATFVAVIFPVAAAPMMTLALVVSYSRVYNGVHFPTDILAGAILGIITGIVMARLCQRFISRFDEDTDNEAQAV